MGRLRAWRFISVDTALMVLKLGALAVPVPALTADPVGTFRIKTQRRYSSGYWQTSGFNTSCIYMIII